MSYATAPHSIAFDLIRDAANLMDAIDPGTTVLEDHAYRPMAIRTRRVYNPEHDSLTLIAYHGDQITGTIIATNNGNKVTARIHQIRVGNVLFTRRGDWTFIGIARVDSRRRRFTLTTRARGGWRLDVNGDQPVIFADLDAAAHHITGGYHPTT
jgi:hypothetical protein